MTKMKGVNVFQKGQLALPFIIEDISTSYFFRHFLLCCLFLNIPGEMKLMKMHFPLFRKLVE